MLFLLTNADAIKNFQPLNSEEATQTQTLNTSANPPAHGHGSSNMQRPMLDRQSVPLMEQAIVSRLRYEDILRASKAYQLAFTDDPLILYLRNKKEQTRSEKIIERVLLSVFLALWIRAKVTLTIDAGKADVIATPPENDSKDDTTDYLAKRLQSLLVQISRKMMLDPEAKRRIKDAEHKLGEAVTRTLGARVKEIWYIDGLWADPGVQGHGYGGAVLDAATILADLAGKATWLQSSNIANTTFYNEHGFETIETVVLGDQNPTWHEKPVVVSIMLREPRKLPYQTGAS